MDANSFISQSLRDPRITRILAAAIDAVEPSKLVREYLQTADLPKYDRVFLLGIGKASEAMTRAAAEFFNNFTDALAITKHASPSFSGIYRHAHALPGYSLPLPTSHRRF